MNCDGWNKLMDNLEKVIKSGNLKKLKTKLNKRKYEDMKYPCYIIDLLEYSLTIDEYEIFEYLVECSKEHTANIIDEQNINNDSYTLLMKIIEHQVDENRIDAILKHSNNINQIDNNNESALLRIVKQYKLNETKADKYTPIIIKLLKHGADLKSHMYEDEGILHELNYVLDFVIQNEMLDVMKLFIEYSSNISNLALFVSIHYGKYDFAEFLIDHIKNINDVIYDGLTPLQIAEISYPRNEDIIELLVENGAKHKAIRAINIKWDSYDG